MMDDDSVPNDPRSPRAPGHMEARSEEISSSQLNAEDEEYEPTPWHFKLLVLGLVLYLVYRAYQLVEWAVHRFL